MRLEKNNNEAAFRSKSVFITGASSGLGRQVTGEFAKRGYDLALAARQLDVLHSIKSELEERHNVRVLVYPLDVSDTDQVRDTLNTASTELSQLDIVVANAGLGSDGRIGRIDFANSRQMFEVNVIGACATIDAAITLFKKQGHGQIVAMSSVASWRGLPGSGAYSASTAAVSVYMEALRAESLGKNLTVTVIYPGFIDTAATKRHAVSPGVAETRSRWPANISSCWWRTPMARPVSSMASVFPASCCRNSGSA